MQLSLFYLRLTEDWHSPLAPAEALQRVQQVTAPSTAFGGSQPHEPALLFQGWIKAESFRIGLLSPGKNRRGQSSVVVEGAILAAKGGSRLRLLYRPLLIQLFALGFWLIFFGTGILVALLEWLRGPAPSFAWQSIAAPLVIYGLVVFFFWQGARRNRRLLVPLLDLVRPDTLRVS